MKTKNKEGKNIALNDLGKFTDEVLLPAIDDLMDQKMDEKLKNFRGQLKLEFATKRDLEKIDEKIDGKFNIVITGQDKILKKLEDIETEQTMDIEVHKRHGEKLENHEGRIQTVEEKLEIAGIIK